MTALTAELRPKGCFGRPEVVGEAAAGEAEGQEARVPEAEGAGVQAAAG
jgi:hypothetical protein